MNKLPEVFFSTMVENETSSIPMISRRKEVHINATIANIPENTPVKLLVYFFHHELDDSSPMRCPTRCQDHISPFHPDNIRLEDHLQFLTLENCKGSFVYAQRLIGINPVKFIEVFVNPPKMNEPAFFRLIFKTNCDLSCDFGTIRPTNHFILQLDLELKGLSWKSEKIIVQLGPRPDLKSLYRLKSPDQARKSKMTVAGSPVLTQSRAHDHTQYKYLAIRGRRNYEILKKLNEGLEAREKLAALGTLPQTNPNSPTPMSTSSFPFSHPIQPCIPRPPLIPTIIQGMPDRQDSGGSIGPIPFYAENEDSQASLIQPLNLSEKDNNSENENNKRK